MSTVFRFSGWRLTPYTRSVLRIVLAFAIFALLGCGKPVNYNDLPVSYWADPKSKGKDALGYADGCSVASAQAILRSGLPYPNHGTREELAADGKTIKKRITTDYWLGGVRFVFPAEIAASSTYPEHNPHRYRSLRGTLPHFYPKGKPAPIKDGMNAMVEVNFGCMMDLKNDLRFVNFIRPRSNQEGIQQVKAEYEILAKSKDYPGVVTLNDRYDIRMIEVLLDRGSESHNQRYWEATYWPMDRELKSSFDGTVSRIRCSIRHDPIQKRYGNRGWTCGAGMRVTEQVHAGITIYVSHLEEMPIIFDQVQQVVINAKKAGG